MKQHMGDPPIEVEPQPRDLGTVSPRASPDLGMQAFGMSKIPCETHHPRVSFRAFVIDGAFLGLVFE